MYEWENQDIFKDVPDFPIISRPLGHDSITGLLFICRAGALRRTGVGLFLAGHVSRRRVVACVRFGPEVPCFTACA